MNQKAQKDPRYHALFPTLRRLTELESGPGAAFRVVQPALAEHLGVVPAAAERRLLVLVDLGAIETKIERGRPRAIRINRPLHPPKGEPPPGGTRLILALIAVDELVHEPRRLELLNFLAGQADGVAFTRLANLTGLTNGNMSHHLKKLEDGELVEVTKEFVLKRPKTSVRITEAGRTALEDHLKSLEELNAAARAVDS